MKDDGTTRPGDNTTRARGHGHFVAKALRRERNGPRSVVSSRWSSRDSAFTLAELLVSMGVLVLLVLLFTQLVNSAATITILGHKRMDADSQARQVFDRMAVDFAQMVKRTDVDYYVKNADQQDRNDQIAFYSNVPGYYPSGSTATQQSPLSLVAYRVNSNPASPAYNRLERLGKGLVWNGAPGSMPLVFLPQTIGGTWPAAVSSSLADPDGNYEVIGPQVFRFEYYYLGTNGVLRDTPCIGTPCTFNGWQQVAAIVVDIAVIDPRSKVLLTDPNIIANLNTNLSNPGNCDSLNYPFLCDYRSDDHFPGHLPNKWQNTINGIINGTILINGNTPPRPAIQGIRVYERYFYLTR